MIWKCRWGTSWPPSVPELAIRRNPPSGPGRQPLSAARRDAKVTILPNQPASSGPMSCSETTWRRGISSKCTGAAGLMSWKATNSSSSWTFFEGISPRAILQKIQLSLIGVPCSGCGAPCFFFQARQAFPACQFGQHVFGPQIVVSQGDEAMKPYVGGLADDAFGHPGFGGPDQLGAFVA